MKNMEFYPKWRMNMEKDRWNRKLWHKGNVRQWFPPTAETSYLWLPFIGKSNWAKGFWILHPKTNYLDFELVDEGEMTIHYNGQRYLIPSGSAVLIPPGESKLSTASARGCRKRYIGISGLILNNNLVGMNLDKVSVLNDFRNAEFEELFALLWTLTEEKRLENIREYGAKVYQLLLLLSHCAIQQPYPEELQRAVTFISQHLSQHLTLEEICSAAYCGRSTLQWQFKHYMNSSPIRYLTETRMKCAVKLLKNTTLSIKEIAQKCGYGDQLYFSAAFREYSGLPPRKYREKADFSPE